MADEQSSGTAYGPADWHTAAKGPVTAGLAPGAAAGAPWEQAVPASRRQFLGGLSAGALLTLAGLAAPGAAAKAGGRALPAAARPQAGAPGGVPQRPLLTPPYALAPSCTLAQDYLMVNPRAASSGNDRVAAFQLGDPLHPIGNTHVVAMIPDATTTEATLYHLRPDASTPGGWATDAIPNTVGVVDFVVASLYNPANNQIGRAHV